MRTVIASILIVFLSCSTLLAQRDSLPIFKHNNSVLGIQIGSNGKLSTMAVSSLAYWNIGRNISSIKLGIGGRFTSSFGKGDMNYITAPVKLTRERVGPIALFTKKQAKNIDTLLLQSTQVNSLNLEVAIHYDISETWGVELNTDLIGFSIGKTQEAILTYGEYNNASRKTNATPTLLNTYLTGDNSIGSLSSELIFIYTYRKNLEWNLGASYLFNEYTIDDPVLYTNSSATVIGTDRYRLKSLIFAIGLNYIFNHSKK